tara:strand:+ start:361581 stop:362882 length:1302 start_codon:yes stop_codon:yes gene_type:complete
LTPENAGVPWSEEELQFLFEERLQNTPYTAISRALGRPYNSCRKTYNETDWSQKPYSNGPKVRQHRRDLKTFKAQTESTVNRALDRWRMRADTMADALVDSAQRLPRAPLVKWKPKNRKPSQHSPEDIGLMLSDLHIGHEHSLEETGNLSQYNVDIFLQRLENLKHAVADIYELHSQLYKIPKLHIFSLGDVVDGMNEAGAWSPVYINTPITDQVMIGVRALSEAIFYWLTIFEEVEFYGVRGNHGRVAKSGAEKDYNNWDRMVYLFLETEYRNNPRIKFNVPKTWWSMQNIRNHKYLLMHGDDAKSKNPPISTFLDVERKMAGYVKDFAHYTLVGHFHNASEITSTNGKVLMNGSFVGSDVYSLKNNLPGTKAEQKIFGIHDTRGITFRYDLDLDDERSRPESTEAISHDTATTMGSSISYRQEVSSVRKSD